MKTIIALSRPHGLTKQRLLDALTKSGIGSSNIVPNSITLGIHDIDVDFEVGTVVSLPSMTRLEKALDMPDVLIKCWSLKNGYLHMHLTF